MVESEDAYQLAAGADRWVRSAHPSGGSAPSPLCRRCEDWRLADRTLTTYKRTLADRLRWYWKIQSRIDSLQVRWIGTSLLAVILRSPVLLLESTGRRSGRRRRSPVMYWRHAGDLFIGGGAAGMTRVDWVANVRADPHATAWVRRRRMPVVVHELEGIDYDEARSQAFERWPRAAKYERSGRPIPYFRLEVLGE